MSRIFFTATIALLLLGAPPATGQALFDTPGAENHRPVRETNGRITGSLPAGWIDNSGWARVWVDYSPAEEEGRRYLRMNITKLEDGHAQLMHDMPGLDGEAFYRLSFVARSPSHTGATFGIRDAGKPYEMVWRHVPGLSPSWKTQTIDFRLGKHGQPVKFMVLANGVGEIHLAHLKLEKRTKEQLIEELKAKYPDGGPGNLFRQTTFPLGLPCGWSIQRDLSDGDEIVLEAGRDGVVPNGSPLLIKPREGKTFRLISQPFEVLRRFEPHTASLFVRGTGEGKLIALSDGRAVGSKPFKAARDWTRISVPFTPGLLAKAHAITLEGAGPIEIDGLQVNAGPKPAEFVLQMPCEVHVAVASPARVFFDDEKVTLTSAAAGNLAGATLKSKIVDAYGRQIPLAAQPIPAGGRGMTLAIDNAASLGLGALRCEAWAEDAGGQRLSPTSEMVFYRLRKPRYWGKDAPESPFGVHTQAIHRHNLMAKSIGCNWVRLHDAGTTYAGWRYVEKEKGQWTFNDEPLHRYRRQHLKIMGCLATSPDWASYIDKHRNSYFDQFWQPRNLDDYATYVRKVAARYKGTIDTWDVWNEPWNQDWWAVRYDEEKGKADARAGYVTSEKPQADFARMVDVAVKNARAIDPKLTVIGVNSTTGELGRRWTQGIVDADGLKLPDVYCYHQYTSESNLFPNDAVERGLKIGLSPILDKVGKFDKPVWMTEGSALRDAIGAGMYQHTFPAGAGEDFVATSDSLCRYVISLLANGVSRVFLYSMHGHNTFGNGGEWRVLVTDEGYLHPSAAAHSNMAWHLEDTKFARRLELAPGLWAYLFAGNGRSVAVVSVLPGKTIAWPKLANPALRVEDLYGNAPADRTKVGPTILYVTLDGGDVEKLAGALLK